MLSNNANNIVLNIICLNFVIRALKFVEEGVCTHFPMGVVLPCVFPVQSSYCQESHW